MYATIDDMANRYETRELIQVTDQTGADVINEAVMNTALSDADNEINTYLAKRYKLPLSPVPVILVSRACDIARYNLWSLKDEMRDVVKVRYNAAIDWLKLVSKGEVILEAEGIPSAEPENTIVMNANPRIFTKASMRYF